jgi:hypothetical protein
MVVASIAYQQLTPEARSRVKVLLKKNPYAKKIWPGMLPPGAKTKDADEMIFMIAATWPDQIKSDGSYKSDGTQNGNRPPDDPSAGQNIGYSDHARHKYWHFVDTPFSKDGTALPAIPSPNAETQIGAFRAVLASDDSSDALKSYDLAWLLHLVGDVHQPLHCSTRVSGHDPDGDSGGNDVALSCTKCELHAYWDDLLGSGKSLATAMKVARKLPAAPADLASKMDEAVWIKESFDVTPGVVYAVPIGPGDGPFSLTPEYRAAAKDEGQQRVALAGARLARLLNAELK